MKLEPVKKEVGSIPVREVIDNMINPKPEEFFKVIEEEYNEQS